MSSATSTVTLPGDTLCSEGTLQREEKLGASTRPLVYNPTLWWK